jgi:hypothetical protein
MSNRRRARGAVSPSAAVPASVQQETVAAQTPVRAGWRRFPIWAWVLIFVVPLALSEYMFYVGGRSATMVLFPIVWVGFWVALWYRSAKGR